MRREQEILIFPILELEANLIKSEKLLLNAFTSMRLYLLPIKHGCKARSNALGTS